MVVGENPFEDIDDRRGFAAPDRVTPVNDISI
jgi:hypothetical protein